MPTYKCRVWFKDALDRETTRSYQVQATDPVAADLAVGLFVADIAAVVEVAPFKSVVYIESDYANSAVAGSNVDEGMTISALLSDGVKKASVQLPGPIQGIRQSGGIIDITGADMLALEDNFTNGNILISDGESCDHFIKATLDI